MQKLPLAGILVFAIVLGLAPVRASSTVIPNTSSNEVETKIIADSLGDLHVLSFVPGFMNSSGAVGIWYSKYSANGTALVLPTEVANDTTIQSADLAVDSKNNAVIVWADDSETGSLTSSVLILLRFNSTQVKPQRILGLRGSLILWPSVAVGANDTIHMAWIRYTPSTERAAVEYGTIVSGRFASQQQLASYDGVNATVMLTRLVYDNSSGHFQVAWGESESQIQHASTINYGVLVSNGTIVDERRVTTFNGTLRDLSLTPIGERDAAFIIWRTEAFNSIYVSQISPNNTLSYVKQFNYTRVYRNFAAADFKDDLYLVCYQPPVASFHNATLNPAESTNVTYLRMNSNGEIVQTGAGVFKVAVIGVTILNDGVVYGVSPGGLVSFASPIATVAQKNQLTLTDVALISVIGLAVGFTSSAVQEEGRYRLATLYSRVVTASNRQSVIDETTKLLERKPGLKIREIKHLARGADININTMALVGMEKNGLLSSFRDGLSRRFYLRNTDGRRVEGFRTRILLWVINHPGIWEAQLSKDLGLSQQIVHYHLRKLSETGLIKSSRDADGSRKLYRFADSRRNPKE